MKKTYKFVLTAVLALLFPLSMMAPATARADALQSSPDTFDQASGKYAKIWANSQVGDLPVIDNDASQDAPDVRICRLDVAPGQTFDFGSMVLRNGRVGLDIGLYYDKPWIQLVYQLCNKEVVGPETLIKVGVLPLKLVTAKKANGRIKLTNANSAPVQCHVSDESGHTYFHKKLAAKSSVSTKARFPRNHWACYIGRLGTDAGHGDL